MDVFIAKKLSHMGNCFGFINFSSVDNLDHMISQLCDVWFGSYKLFDSFPRSMKDNNSQSLNVVNAKVINQDMNENVVRVSNIDNSTKK